MVALGLVPGGTAVAEGHAAARTEFVPAEVAEAGSLPQIFVLGTSQCGPRLCLQLWEGRAGSFSQRQAPPSNAPREAGSAGSVERLVFANTSDGYALEPPESPGSAYRYYFTLDGGAKWQLASFGPHATAFAFAASAKDFYAVLADCTGTPEHCSGYRLARSPVASQAWTSVNIPGTASLDGSQVAMTVSGNTIWLTYTPHSGGSPQLVESNGGQAPFRSLAEPSLVGVTACRITAMPGGAIWAACPTGMLVSYLYTPDGGQHFRAFWDVAGTGGADFDPISPTIAYRYTGIWPAHPSALQVTTDAGRSFSTVSHLPFGAGADVTLLFVNRDQGYALGPTLLYTADGGERWEHTSVG